MIHVDVVDLINETLDEKLSWAGSNWYQWHRLPSHYRFSWINFSPTDRTRVSGIAKNITCDTPPSNEFIKDKGTYIKIGKLLKALLPDMPIDKVNIISQKINTKLRSRGVMQYDEIKTSSTPSEIYTLQHNNSISSCMTDQEASFFHLYDDLENCKIAYHITSGLITGRALLWSCVDIGNESVPVMDRIYYANDNILALFKAWASKYGYAHKLSQSIGDVNLVHPDGLINSYNMAINTHDLIASDYTHVPYLDTFNRYTELDQTLSNFKRYDTLLQETDGSDSENIITAPIYKCTHCGERAVNTEDELCEYCMDNHYTWVDCCECRVLNDDVYWVESEDRYICGNCYDYSYFTCNECGNIYDNNNNINGYCSDCAANIFYRCQNCGDYIENAIKINYEYYCSDCAANIFDQCEKCGLRDSDLNYFNEKYYCDDCLGAAKYEYYLTKKIYIKRLISIGVPKAYMRYLHE
jgi:hypothetical protein